jgi:surface polysaccharide O-acyltransferase-like enzyme
LVDSVFDSTKRIQLPDDLIRSLAIFLVIVLHASNEALASNALGSSYWWTGAVYKTLSLSCVPLFVMLSGALLLQPIKLDEPIRVFLKKRLSRIGLAFAFWTIAYLAWSFFIRQIPVTPNNIAQGILKSLFGGAYYQFWFIYLIVGLYLITPILRVIVARDNTRITRYLIALWFVAVAILPLVNLATGYVVDSGVFVIGGWVGYFLLGTHLQKIRIKALGLFSLLIVTFVWTLLGIWLMSAPLMTLGQGYFFFDYLTANVIVGSAALFMLLMRFHPDWSIGKSTVLKRLIQTISRNTLPIFLFHVIILECFFRGFFGFTLSSATLNPIVEIPLTTALTLLLTLGLVLLMRRVPILQKLIG